MSGMLLSTRRTEESDAVVQELSSGTGSPPAVLGSHVTTYGVPSAQQRQLHTCSFAFDVFLSIFNLFSLSSQIAAAVIERSERRTSPRLEAFGASCGVSVLPQANLQTLRTSFDRPNLHPPRPRTLHGPRGLQDTRPARVTDHGHYHGTENTCATDVHPML